MGSDAVELGHLAAPPRTRATLEGIWRNVSRLRQVIGSLPEQAPHQPVAEGLRAATRNRA